MDQASFSSRGPVLYAATADSQNQPPRLIATRDKIGIIRHQSLLAAACLILSSHHSSAQSVAFGNFVPGQIDAPVFDIDCLTRLQGPTFVAQAFVGETVDTLLPMGTPIPFAAGNAAGYIPPQAVSVPGPAFQPVFVQMRAWEVSAGDSYGEAVISGGKYGFSNIVPTFASTQDAPFPVGLKSFCLVPEPECPVLWLIGGAALWMKRSSKKRSKTGV